MKIIRPITELTDIEKQDIFFSAFPDIHTILFDFIVSYIEKENDILYLVITMPEAGCSIKIWENYDISLDNDVAPINRIKIVSIFHKLMEIGAISWEC